MPRRKGEGRKPPRPSAPEPSPPAPYQVRLSSTAVKDLKDLGPVEAKAVRALRRLMTDPLAGHPLTGELKGLRSLEFSLPGGAYRAVYAVKREVRTSRRPRRGTPAGREVGLGAWDTPFVQPLL